MPLINNPRGVIHFLAIIKPYPGEILPDNEDVGLAAWLLYMRLCNFQIRARPYISVAWNPKPFDPFAPLQCTWICHCGRPVQISRLKCCWDEAFQPTARKFGCWHLQQSGLWRLLWCKQSRRACSPCQENAAWSCQCDVRPYQGFGMGSSELFAHGKSPTKSKNDVRWVNNILWRLIHMVGSKDI